MRGRRASFPLKTGDVTNLNNDHGRCCVPQVINPPPENEITLLSKQQNDPARIRAKRIFGAFAQQLRTDSYRLFIVS